MYQVKDDSCEHDFVSVKHMKNDNKEIARCTKCGLEYTVVVDDKEKVFFDRDGFLQGIEIV